MEEKKEYPYYVKSEIKIGIFHSQIFYRVLESGHICVSLSKDGALIETKNSSFDVGLEESSEEEFIEAFEIAVETIDKSVK